MLLPADIFTAMPTSQSTMDTSTSPACPDDMLFCSSSQKCLPKSLICNGELDCADGVDENGCADESTVQPTKGAVFYSWCSINFTSI